MIFLCVQSMSVNLDNYGKNYGHQMLFGGMG